MAALSSIFILLHCFVQWLQDKYMQQMSEELIVPYSIQERCIDEEKGTGTHIRAVTPILPLSLGNIATYVSYNRPKTVVEAPPGTLSQQRGGQERYHAGRGYSRCGAP